MCIHIHSLYLKKKLLITIVFILNNYEIGNKVHDYLFLTKTIYDQYIYIYTYLQKHLLVVFL